MNYSTSLSTTAEEIEWDQGYCDADEGDCAGIERDVTFIRDGIVKRLRVAHRCLSLGMLHNGATLLEFVTDKSVPSIPSDDAFPSPNHVKMWGSCYEQGQAHRWAECDGVVEILSDEIAHYIDEAEGSIKMLQEGDTEGAILAIEKSLR